METLLAILAVVSMLSAVIMAAFAWKLNSDWSRLTKRWTDIADRQDESFIRMNQAWCSFYQKIIGQ